MKLTREDVKKYGTLTERKFLAEMPQMSHISRNNTSIKNDAYGISVTLHGTTVFEFNKRSGEIKLDSGGWMTSTTKNRINQAFNKLGLAYTLSQKEGEWHVYDRKSGDVIPFEDGMIIQL